MAQRDPLCFSSAPLSPCRNSDLTTEPVIDVVSDLTALPVPATGSLTYGDGLEIKFAVSGPNLGQARPSITPLIHLAFKQASAPSANCKSC